MTKEEIKELVNRLADRILDHSDENTLLQNVKHFEEACKQEAERLRTQHADWLKEEDT